MKGEIQGSSATIERRGGVNLKKLQTLAIIFLLALSLPIQASANMQGESVYDLLVDRYFNQTSQNDKDVNTQDSTAFAGGDFLGVLDRLDHIKKMGFTYISLGPVFKMSDYQGETILSYSEIEPRFGTEEEFIDVIDTLHQQEIQVMVDLPLENASEENFEEMLEFVQQYEIDGVKLTGLSAQDEPQLNAFVDELKSLEIDILSLEPHTLNLSAGFSDDTVSAFQQAFKNTDLDTSYFSSLDYSQILAIDTLDSERFTHFSTEENMFPPTRIKMALGALMTLPGVPVMTYGTEIAMNGTTEETSHQIMNFRVDEDIMLFVEDLQTVRNQSSAFQAGDFEMIENNDGLLVFKRWTDEEAFIVVINNTSQTQSLELSEEVVGVDQELRGLLEQDIIRQESDGSYKVTLDRELVELYQVKENNGLNTAYIVAMIIAYLLFMLFLYLVWRKGKQNKAK